MDKESSNQPFLYKGAVVWAKVYGYPWWPASITTDQRSGKWFHKGKYWVYFFNDPQGAWLKPNCLKEFNETNTAALTPKENHRNYKQIIKAVEEAKEVHSNMLPPEQVAALIQAATEEKEDAENSANATTEEEDTSEEEPEKESKAQSQNSSRGSSRKRKMKQEESSQSSKKQLRTNSRESRTSLHKGFRYRDLVFQMPVDRPYQELDSSYLENPQSLDTTAEELQTEVEQLQQLSNKFCSKVDSIKSLQESLMSLSEQINEKIRQLEKCCDEAYSVEGQVLHSLKKLFQSRVTIAMLKNSRAGKPVVELERSCGPNSSSIRSMAKQLVRQWKKMVMESTPSKSSEETVQVKTMESEERDEKEISSSHEENTAEDSTLHPLEPSEQEDGRKELADELCIENNSNCRKFSPKEKEETTQEQVIQQ